MRAPQEWYPRAHPRTHCKHGFAGYWSRSLFQTSRSRPPSRPRRPRARKVLPSPVKVLRSSDGHQAVGVCEFGKTTDLTVVLERRSDRHEKSLGAARLWVLGRQIRSEPPRTSPSWAPQIPGRAHAPLLALPPCSPELTSAARSPTSSPDDSNLYTLQQLLP